MITCLIVDDEPLAREGIRLLVQDDGEISIAGECGSGRDALRFFEQHNVDLMYLDVQMPGMTGIELLERLSDNKRPVVIFCTAYDQYAIAAFKHHALNYLLKPYSDREFYAVLAQAKELLSMKKLQPVKETFEQLIAELKLAKERAHEEYIHRFAVTVKGNIVPVNVDEVAWIEAADYYVNIHTQSQSYLIRETLAALEKKLDPKKFVRIHRSTIVKIDAIQELRQGFGGSYSVVLRNGEKLKLSKSYKYKLSSFLHFP